MIPPSNPDPKPALPAQRSIVVDMSPEAIDLRLRELGQLNEFWKSFRRCRIIGPIPPTDLDFEMSELS